MKYINNKKIVFIIITLATLNIYQLTQVKPATGYNHFVLLSERMMHGRVDLNNPPDYLELSLDQRTGKKYVPYPPLPAVLIMPFVYFNLLQKSQTQYAILFGALDIGLFYLLTTRWFNSNRIGILLAISLGFGTCFWYLATEGSSWYISHIVAIFFLVLSLLMLQIQQDENTLKVTYSTQRWFFSGLFLGCAYLSRDPTILAILFFLFLPLSVQPYEQHDSSNKLKYYLNQILHFKKQLAFFILPILITVSLIAYYNYVRFGTIKPVQHEHIPHLLELSIFNKGFLNIAYIPRNLVFFFTKRPLSYEKFPY